jgi:hypothetical protein
VLVKGEVVDDGVVLCDNRGELCDDSELGPFEFIDKVVEVAVEAFLLVLLLVDAELQFADDSVAEEEVDEDVVVLLKHPVLYLHDAQVAAVQLLHFVQQTQYVYKLVLFATITGSQQVAHLESHQVYLSQLLQVVQRCLLLVLQVLVVLVEAFSGRDGDGEQGVHQAIEVAEGVLRDDFLELTCEHVDVGELADELALHVITRKHALQYFIFILQCL